MQSEPETSPQSEPAAEVAPPPARDPWHRPWGVMLLGIGILVGSAAFSWLVGWVHWYAWSMASYDYAATHEQNLRVFYNTAAYTIVASIALQGSATLLSFVFVRGSADMVPAPSSLWIQKPRLSVRAWPIVMLGCFGVMFLTGYATQWLEYFGLMPQGTALHDQTLEPLAEFRGVTALMVVLVMSVMAGVGEEVSCRGFLLRGLLREWPAGRAIVVSAVIFAAAHLDAAYVVGVLPIGLWLGYVAYRTRSIVVTAVAHTLIDVYGIGLYAVPPTARENTAVAAAGWLVFIAGCLCVLPTVFILERAARRARSLVDPAPQEPATHNGPGSSMDPGPSQ